MTPADKVRLAAAKGESVTVSSLINDMGAYEGDDYIEPHPWRLHQAYNRPRKRKITPQKHTKPPDYVKQFKTGDFLHKRNGPLRGKRLRYGRFYWRTPEGSISPYKPLKKP